MDKKYNQVFRLFGYAGTGKTTLAQHFASNASGNVLFGAYTGKAALVLREKGCPNATTIHQMIYQPKSKSKVRLRELELEMAKVGNTADPDYLKKLQADITKERERLAQPAFTLLEESDVSNASLIIIDEVSMVDGQIGSDLLSFGVPVLVLGDPAQLPPVGGGGFFTKVEYADVMLTEIHRQAKDNPIIDMATQVREGKRLALGDYGQCRVTDQNLAEDEVLGTEQILVGRNNTRHATNDRLRLLMGITDPHPTENEKLVCLRNDHEVGLLNGGLWKVEDVADVDDESLYMSVSPYYTDDGEVLDVEAWMHPFQGRENTLDWFEKKDKQEFDYGYALTCHKSQGSSWRDVVVIDESSCFRNNAAKWLYTAITRASEKVTIVRR